MRTIGRGPLSQIAEVGRRHRKRRAFGARGGRLAAFACGLLASVAFARSIAITDVTVVDTTDGALVEHRTVVVADGRIAAVTRSDVAPPGDASIVDGRGRYLVPGLWDMVTHLSWTRQSALPALVANGITAVRDQGGDLAETAVWAEGVRAGTLIGPTIFQVGPMLNGRSFNRHQFAIDSPEGARSVVRLLAHQRVDGLEVERRVPRDVYFALIDEAREAGLPVGGKVPLEVEPAEASDAGQASIDNLETIYDGVFRARHAQDPIAGIEAFLAPGGGADALFARFRRNGTAVTPCVAIFAYALAHDDPASPADPNLRYVAVSNRRPSIRLPPDELAEFTAMMPLLMRTVARLREAGVTLLAGTDIAGDRVPGFSLHDELEALARAGLTPIEALRAATLAPARVMRRTDDYGSVAPGKIADLLLLAADPTRDIAATRRIVAVMLHGRLLDRAALDAQLEEAAALAATN